MKRQLINSRSSVTLVLLIGLLLSIAFVGAIAFNTTLVSAQTPDNEEAETETQDADDEAEGQDIPITGNALEQASAAALEYIGEGQVTDTEVGDEEGYYEVEITLDNGRQVDVHLDEAFNVLGHEND